jgi:hypothetical protein
VDQQLYNHACWIEDIVQGPSLEIQDLWLTINMLMRRVTEIEEYLGLQASHQPIALYSGSSHVQVQHIGSQLEPMGADVAIADAKEGEDMELDGNEVGPNVVGQGEVIGANNNQLRPVEGQQAVPSSPC